MSSHYNIHLIKNEIGSFVPMKNPLYHHIQRSEGAWTPGAKASGHADLEAELSYYNIGFLYFVFPNNNSTYIIQCK